MAIPQLNFRSTAVVDPTEGAQKAVTAARTGLNSALELGLYKEKLAQSKLAQERDYAFRLKADERADTEFGQRQSAYNAEKAFNSLYSEGPQSLLNSVDGEYSDAFVGAGGHAAVLKRLGLKAPAAQESYSPENQKKLDDYYLNVSKDYDKSIAGLGRESELQLVSRAAQAAGENSLYSPVVAEKLKAARAAEAAMLEKKRSDLLGQISTKASEIEAARKNAITEAAGEIYAMGDSSHRTSNTFGDVSGKGNTKGSSGKDIMGWSQEVKGRTVKELIDDMGIPDNGEAEAKAVLQKALDNNLSYDQIHAIFGRAMDFSIFGDSIDQKLGEKLVTEVVQKRDAEREKKAQGGASGLADRVVKTTGGTAKSYDRIGNPELAKYHAELYGRLAREKQALDAQLSVFPTELKNTQDKLRDTATQWAEGATRTMAAPVSAPIKPSVDVSNQRRRLSSGSTTATTTPIKKDTLVPPVTADIEENQIARPTKVLAKPQERGFFSTFKDASERYEKAKQVLVLEERKRRDENHRAAALKRYEFAQEELALRTAEAEKKRLGLLDRRRILEEVIGRRHAEELQKVLAKQTPKLVLPINYLNRPEPVSQNRFPTVPLKP